MAVPFRSPEDQPHGCFHPRSRFHGFREGGTYWPSVLQYCIAQRLASREDRERVRTARDPEHAHELAASMLSLAGRAHGRAHGGARRTAISQNGRYVHCSPAGAVS